MHIELDRVLVRLSETAVREIMARIEECKKNTPSKRTMLLKSSASTMRFLVDMAIQGRPPQKVFDFQIAPLEVEKNEKTIPRTFNNNRYVSGY